MKRVCFYEAFEEEACALRRYLPENLFSTEFTSATIQESEPGKGGQAEVISIRTQSRIPEKWASSLTGVLTRSTGYDHLAEYRKLTRSAGIVAYGYLPLYCARAVAEQAMLMWSSLMRQLNLQQTHFKTFFRNGLSGWEMQNKTLAVLGVGNIGAEAVQIGEGLGMRVLGVDIVPRYASVTYVSLEQALAQADVIVCAMNLTEQNKNLLNSATLSACRDGTVFVNVARGELAPSSDLLSLLQGGKLGGVGLDVYNKESLVAEAFRGGTSVRDPEIDAVREMAKRSDVILTPHNAFNTYESVERKAQQTVEQVMALYQQGAFKWQVPGES